MPQSCAWYLHPGVTNFMKDAFQENIFKSTSSPDKADEQHRAKETIQGNVTAQVTKVERHRPSQILQKKKGW